MKIGYAYIPPGTLISDSRGHPVFGSIERKPEATLMFLDLDPGATWPHPCFYILVPADGESPVKVDHPWPPSPALELRPCR